MNDWFRSHYIAFLLALLVGGVYLAPHIYLSLQPEYQGIYMAESTDEDFYATTINKSYDREGLVGNPFLYEYQTLRNSFQYYAVEFLLGKIGNLFGLSTATLLIAAKFVFPFLLTLLFYAFALFLSRSRATALLVAVAMLFGNELARPNLIDTFNTLLFSGPWTQFLLYARPVNPQVSALLFYSVLFILAYLFKNPRSKPAIGVAGILLGLLGYVYFFFFAFAAILAGVMFAYALFVRAWPLVRALLWVAALSIAFSAPFLYALAVVLAGEGGTTITRAVPTHAFIVEKMILVPLCIYLAVFLFGWWSGQKSAFGLWCADFFRRYRFVFLMLLTGLLVSNQQVLTGKLLEQQHFHFFTNIPLFIFSMSLLFAASLTHVSRNVRLSLIACAILGLCWFATGEQVSSYVAHKDAYQRYQYLSPIFTYLVDKAPRNAVVLTDRSLASRTTMYAPQYVYYSAYDSSYQVPEERVWHGYFVTLALRGVRAEDVRAYVQERGNRNEVGYLLFGGLYYRALCGWGGCFPDSVIEEIVPQYKTFTSKPLLEQVHKYKVDYVLADKASPEQNFTSIVKQKPVLESGDFKLYEIRPLP